MIFISQLQPFLAGLISEECGSNYHFNTSVARYKQFGNASSAGFWDRFGEDIAYILHYS